MIRGAEHAVFRLETAGQGGLLKDPGVGWTGQAAPIGAWALQEPCLYLVAWPERADEETEARTFCRFGRAPVTAGHSDSHRRRLSTLPTPPVWVQREPGNQNSDGPV